ncbi:MAG: diguanylate cyclase [Sulfuritalea sp.]|jgi:diguanylate cyclase (GGDEF)-like protein/PAS domain S-box-containing protein|nr:diguanylate cyclase [Sulfuritalea sp.]
MQFWKSRLPELQEASESGKAGVGGRAEFKLLLFFTTTSLVAFVVVAVLLGYVFRTLAIDGLISGYESEHVNHAQVLANEMWDDDFGPLILSLAGKSAADVKAAPQIPAILKKVSRLLKGTKIFKIKVYDLRGMTIFSTEPGQIGEDKSSNAGVMDGLRGRNSSRLTHRDQFSAFEGEVQNRDLVESYIPRYDPATAKVSGVFEIYGDATSILSEVDRRQWYMVFSVIGLLTLLYLVLSAIVKSAQDLIVQQSQERERAQEALRLASTVFLTMDEAVTVTNAENVIVSVNPAFSVITGYPASEVIGKNPKLLASGAHSAEFYREMWEKLDTEGHWHGEIQNRSKSGALYVEWVSIKKVCSNKGVPTHYVAVFSDISERKASEQRMQHLAHFDVLTGLANRTLFSDRLRQTLAKARRDKTHMALMFIDLDKFKPVNDELGHHVGDMLLKLVANRLAECVRRESDTVGRMGGDEFVVMLPEIETMQDAMTVAGKILHALGQTFEIAEHVIHISCSIGIAMFPEHGKDEGLLLKSADAAMYRAKERGRNCVEVANHP